MKAREVEGEEGCPEKARTSREKVRSNRGKESLETGKTKSDRKHRQKKSWEERRGFEAFNSCS